MTIFFTSDTHFSHFNVIRYSKRPFITPSEELLIEQEERDTAHRGGSRSRAAYKLKAEIVERMNEALISNWNSRVRPNDIVHHLGDFAFCAPEQCIEILKRLNGKIQLTFGNHDKRMRKEANVMAYFETARDKRQLNLANDVVATIDHFPSLSWDKGHHGAWMLHGHCHGSYMKNGYPMAGKICDVGVDCWNYAPVSLDELRIHMDKLSNSTHHD